MERLKKKRKNEERRTNNETDEASHLPAFAPAAAFTPVGNQAIRAGEQIEAPDGERSLFRKPQPSSNLAPPTFGEQAVPLRSSKEAYMTSNKLPLHIEMRHDTYVKVAYRVT